MPIKKKNQKPKSHSGVMPGREWNSLPSHTRHPPTQLFSCQSFQMNCYVLYYQYLHSLNYLYLPCGHFSLQSFIMKHLGISTTVRPFTQSVFCSPNGCFSPLLLSSTDSRIFAPALTASYHSKNRLIIFSARYLFVLHDSNLVFLTAPLCFAILFSVSQVY